MCELADQCRSSGKIDNPQAKEKERKRKRERGRSEILKAGDRRRGSERGIERRWLTG